MLLRFLLVIGLFLGMYDVGVSFAGEGGAAIYESLKCGACHDAAKKTVGVSLGELAKAYPEKGKLVQFLKGESKPIVESESWGMMRAQMKKIAPLQEQEKEALADYILSFK